MRPRHTSKPVAGRTRWGKFALLMVPAMLLGVGMAVATATGSMAASFAVSATSFKISADRLEGEGFAQFGSFVVDGEDGEHAVAPAGIAEAKLYNLCQSAVYDTPMGEFTIRISAGTDPDNPVEATNLVVDTFDLSGDATFTNIEIGRDASTLDQVPGHVDEVGAFGQQADTIVVDGLRQENWAVSAGTFTFKDLHMSISPGVDECY